MAPASSSDPAIGQCASGLGRCGRSPGSPLLRGRQGVGRTGSGGPARQELGRGVLRRGWLGGGEGGGGGAGRGDGGGLGGGEGPPRRPGAGGPDAPPVR